MIREQSYKLRKVFGKVTWYRIALSFVLVIVPVLVFTELAEEVGQRETLAFDEAVLLAINGQQSRLLDDVSVVLTQFGSVIGVSVLVLSFVALLWLHGHRAKAVFLAISVGGAGLLNAMLKSLFQRDRPELWQRLVTENSFSFPSGHAMVSSALALSLIVIFWRTRYRWPVVASALIYILLIGFTRLYLGVHYPTDVVAGWIVSGVWVAAVTSAIYYRRIILRARREKSS